MDEIRTFSLVKHSSLFAVPDNSKAYLFVQVDNHPYLEEPYRAESYSLAFLKEGSINLQAGLVKHQVEAPSIIALAPSVIRIFSESSDIMKMDILFFKDTLLLEKKADLFFLMKYDFFENNELNVLRLSGGFHQKIKDIFRLLYTINDSAHPYQLEIIRNYTFILIYEIDAQFRQQIPEVASVGNVSPLFAKFKQLLTSNYLQERKLGFYAARLFVTAKYLSAIIKEQTGKSAREWIDEAVILEAKVLLQNKSLTVSQISDQLNFSDQSVFGKFFKSNAGMSPIDYRKKF